MMIDAHFVAEFLSKLQLYGPPIWNYGYPMQLFALNGTNAHN